jgi:integrase/recombinase XerD
VPRHAASKPPPGDATDPRGFAARTVEFLAWMRVQNYSADTIDIRADALYGFIEWCHERSVFRPSDVTKPILERYQRWLYHYRRSNGKPLKFTGQHLRLSAVRLFYKFLARQNYVLYNPASDLVLPRPEKHLPQHFTLEEVERVLNTPDLRSAEGVRDRAMMETLYSTGIRRAELASLDLSDLDADAGTVRVRQGKGKRDRMVPIGERAVAWVAKYLAEVRPEYAVRVDELALFLNHFGRRFRRDQLSQSIHRYIKDAGVTKPGACHLFRHTMATLMLENGADVRFIQEMLGHAELSTTEVYTHVSIGKLKEIHRATHPARLERKKGAAESGAIDSEKEREKLLSSLAAEADDEEDESGAGE